ncbi:MAG: hypothetical protein K0R36_2688 [Chryseobacterium sp.]|nr:hypothetical protein [Chryseobacterium sp.]
MLQFFYKFKQWIGQKFANPNQNQQSQNNNDVFRHFQPAVAVQHETEDGNVVEEEFRFQNLADFTPKNLVQKSDYLQQLSMEQEQYNKIVRQLKTNKILRNMLENEQTRAAFIEALKEVAQELEK